MDVLNALFSEADWRGELTLLWGHNIKHSASVYAGDLVMFLAPTTRDLVCVRQILDLFTGASGLSMNLDKCAITLICCTHDMIQEALGVFPCRVQEFPTKYLGAPLALTKLCRVQEQALIDKVSTRIPTWKVGLLTQAGRAALT